MNSTVQVNYNDIAGSYDQRSRFGYLDSFGPPLARLVAQTDAQHILDVGCGTGRALQVLAEHLSEASLRIGLDFSAGMLNTATRSASRWQSQPLWVQASAPFPPFKAAFFDLITIVHAFHHFPQQQKVVDAAFTLLRPGGVLAIANFDPREIGDKWPVYRYFEGTYEADLQRFPGVANLEMMFRQAGFQQVTSPVAEVVDETITGEAIFKDYWLQKEACSQLILLSQPAYQAGLRRIEAEVARARKTGSEAVFHTFMQNRLTHGFKPD
jgi:SAM-dependent methyltransferase